MSDTSKITKLGNGTSGFKTQKDFIEHCKTLPKSEIIKALYNRIEPKPELLETFANQHPETDYVIPFECFEFTSNCPATGQPDFAKFFITYIPGDKCVESKSLKLYLNSFRDSGEFMEDITNRVMKDLIALLAPKYIEVYADFNSRGGIYLRPFVNSYRTDCLDKNFEIVLNRFAFTSSK